MLLAARPKPPAPMALALWLAASGCGANSPRPITVVGQPTVYPATVGAARGPVLPQPGDACTIRVTATNDVYFNCRIEVECADDVVYGIGEGGYNACYEQDGRFVFARDRNGTRTDGDPRLYFDLPGGRLYVSDDAPDTELEIDVSGMPAGYAGPPPPPDALPGLPPSGE